MVGDPYSIGSVQGILPTSFWKKPNRMSHATPRPTVIFLPGIFFQRTPTRPQHRQDHRVIVGSPPMLGFQIDTKGVHHNLLGMVMRI